MVMTQQWKISRVGASTTTDGRLFQILMVAGKKECLNACVLLKGMMKHWAWPQANGVVWWRFAVGMSTSSWTMRYIITALLCALLCSNVFQFRTHWTEKQLCVTLIAKENILWDQIRKLLNRKNWTHRLLERKNWPFYRTILIIYIALVVP